MPSSQGGALLEMFLKYTLFCCILLESTSNLMNVTLFKTDSGPPPPRLRRTCARRSSSNLLLLVTFRHCYRMLRAGGGLLRGTSFYGCWGERTSQPLREQMKSHKQQSAETRSTRIATVLNHSIDSTFYSHTTKDHKGDGHCHYNLCSHYYFHSLPNHRWLARKKTNNTSNLVAEINSLQQPFPSSHYPWLKHYVVAHNSSVQYSPLSTQDNDLASAHNPVILLSLSISCIPTEEMIVVG